jgi:predicted ATPase
MISLGQASVSLELRDVFKSGVPLRIGTRAFDILEVLIQCPGRVVTKDEILQRVWPETVVEENNLQVHVSALRKALGADRDLIRTIPGRGYLLVCGESEPVAGEVSTPACDVACAQLRTADLPHNTVLIGRDAVLEEVCAALQASSLLTLVGSGGIGKTSLAVAVAHRLSMSEALPVCFVTLAPINCPERVVDALAAALGVAATPGQSQMHAIVDCLNARDRLLVLDNCEHLIGAVAALSEHLIHSCPALRILATSREPLRISHERSLSVAPLDVPLAGAERRQVLQCSAAQLFLTRLRALDSAFPDDESPALDTQSVELIGALCRQLDGVPLALEMAAARASTLGLFELLASLQDNLHLLAGGLRTAPVRHQSLEASVDWSYRLLCADEQAVLGSVGRLEGRFTLEQACEAAQSAAIPRARVMDCIVGLALKSLLAVTTEGPFKFYRLLGATRTCIVHKLRTPAPVSLTLSTLRGDHGRQQEADFYFHLNHQRVLATSQ